MFNIIRTENTTFAALSSLHSSTSKLRIHYTHSISQIKMNKNKCDKISDQKLELDWKVTASIGVIGGSILLLSVLSAPFILVPASRKLGSLPWMATPNHAIDKALRQVTLLKKASSSSQISRGPPSIVDLGSGDGRLCILASKNYGYKSLGLELNPVLIGLSYYNAWKAGRIVEPVAEAELGETRPRREAQKEAGSVKSTVLSQVQFKMQDFWSVPLSEFDVITVFGVRSIMSRLEDKLTVEATKELYVVCYRFPLPTKTAVYSKDELFIYRFDDTSVNNQS